MSCCGEAFDPPRQQMSIDEEETLELQDFEPHTIPYCSERAKLKEEDERIRIIEEEFPLTPDVIKFIIGEDILNTEDSTQVNEEEVCELEGFDSLLLEIQQNEEDDEEDEKPGRRWSTDSNISVEDEDTIDDEGSPEMSLSEISLEKITEQSEGEEVEIEEEEEEEEEEEGKKTEIEEIEEKCQKQLDELNRFLLERAVYLNEAIARFDEIEEESEKDKEILAEIVENARQNFPHIIDEGCEGEISVEEELELLSSDILDFEDDYDYDDDDDV